MFVVWGQSASPLGVTCNMSQVLDGGGFAGPGLSHQQHRLPFANTHRELFNKNRGWPRSSKGELLPGEGKVYKQLEEQAASFSLCYFEESDFPDSTNKKKETTQSDGLHVTTQWSPTPGP